MGLANRVVADGEALAVARVLVRDIAAFPQRCVETDRASLLDQWSLPQAEAIAREFDHGIATVAAEGVRGAGRFVAGEGRGGKFS